MQWFRILVALWPMLDSRSRRFRILLYGTEYQFHRFFVCPPAQWLSTFFAVVLGCEFVCLHTAAMTLVLRFVCMEGDVRTGWANVHDLIGSELNRLFKEQAGALVSS